MAEHANHAHDLPAMQCGMFQHVPQDPPARKALLNFARKHPPGSQVRSRAQTIEPNSFSVVDMPESGENAAVRNAQLALKLVAGERGAAV